MKKELIIVQTFDKDGFLTGYKVNGELVRCKDCKFNPKYAYVGCPTAGLLLRDDNDFCSKGERRNDE